MSGVPGPDAPRTGVVRGLLNATKRRHPRVYFQVRRAAALAGWYLHRFDEAARGVKNSPFDADFWHRNDVGDWDGFARLLLEYFPASAVLDVGCGDARLLGAMTARSIDLRAVGVDSSPAALERASARGVDAQMLNLAEMREGAVAACARRLGAFDVAMSLEVVEHLPAWHSAKLLRLLTACAPVVVFSGAQPLQGGVLHVNERPLAHWVRRFRELGYEPSPANDAFRAELRRLDLPPWYAANVNVFVRPGG